MAGTTDVLPDPADGAPPRDTDEEPLVDAVAPQSGDALAATESGTPRSTTTRAAGRATRTPGVSVRRSRAVLAIAGALVLAGGFLVGSGGQQDAPQTRRALGAAADASVPSAWTRRVPAPTIDGIALDDPVAYGPRDRPAAMLLAGVARDAVGPTLLPLAFRRRLTGNAPSDDVRLASGLRARRYRGLLPRGGETPLTLLLVATDVGTLTVVCREGSAGAGFVKACQRAAGTVELRGAEAFDLGGDRSYGAQLTAALARLAERRGDALDRLNMARTGQGQANAASAAAEAYAVAARALASTPPNPLVREHNAAIRTALRAQAGRYETLSGAAGRSWGRTYRRTVRAIADGDTRLRKTIAALNDVGFTR